MHNVVRQSPGGKLSAIVTDPRTLAIGAVTSEAAIPKAAIRFKAMSVQISTSPYAGF
jgi:hypothetical protein